ncbi:hypothetical protein K493DRAFT_241697 [Basidiobolus meristosporus CBS 931.73]|uniref:Transglutaminase-like domain-containing protein n=1 Tax=Basidiobolus meristosporus CBS 931.73 TaxID=1314790 RepID=A0A1Y1X735_9FUNG|nr:hypothetical protein K493DRAFT_241697 [Basidiobolus meristosporus CBS 931.73]|eukprot:ORX81579.1 hypothetical protein K493DRAFT_241697 [Basidiobolus meristosporus CBS 931.73]
MAQACGLESYIITGYQKGPTDEYFGTAQTPLPNHWWNAVKVNGEFRFIDIGSASPLHLYNHLKQPDYFYFLAHPLHFIYTHYPNNPKFQFLSPPISPKIFWALPYIQPSFFYDEIKFIDYTDSIFQLEDEETGEFSIMLPSGLGCFAEVDIPNKNATYYNHLRTLVHISEQDGQNIARISIRLNKGKGSGFLKVFIGPKIQAPTNTNPYPLSFSFMLKHTGDKLPNDFVMTFFTEHDFTIKEPRDLILKCGRGYRFVVATPCATKPIKLSVRSPSQHNNIFSYFPDEHSYAAEVFLKEQGKWTLAYLTGKDKWVPFAQYECH